MQTRVLIILIIAPFIWFTVNAQKLFVVSDLGTVQEIKKGFNPQKYRAPFLGIVAMTVNTPKKVGYGTITNPFKLYIYNTGEFNIKEWYFAPMYESEQTGSYFPSQAFCRNKLEKCITVTPVSKNIVEVEIDLARLKKMKPTILKSKILRNIAVQYLSTKSKKKEGDEEKYWCVPLSDAVYEDDQTAWTNEEIEESIEEIITTKHTTHQLFASLRRPPVPTPSGNNTIQYVVVNNAVPNVGLAQSSSPTTVEDQIISDVDKNIPYSGSEQPNTFALIIANEDYTRVAPVTYAKRDGEKVAEYLSKSIGLPENNIKLLKNATLNDMKYEFNRLAKIAAAYDGTAQLIVYYTGHGIPDEKNGNGCLLPIDGYGTDVTTAYSLVELYSLLGNLNVKRTILITDACFSGASKEGDMLLSARGIAIKVNKTRPHGNLLALSACQGDETAYCYKEKGHGLMTYYFLKKLQETSGTVTIGELTDYIIDNVVKTSIVVNGKPQTPSLAVSSNLQDEWREMPFKE